MLYAILCYDCEDAIASWTKDQHAGVMSRLGAVATSLAEQGRLGPVAQLVPTTAAVTIRKTQDAPVLDGPFAETKEQLLGFFVVECASLEEAIATTQELARANGQGGSYEVRPMKNLMPGTLPAERPSTEAAR